MSGPQRPLPIVLAYVLAAASVMVVTGITRLLDTIAPGYPNIFIMFAAVATLAWFLGAGPGCFSAVLSIAGVYLFLMPPMDKPAFSYVDISWIVTFGACAAAATALGRKRRATQAMSESARADLEHRVEERTKSLKDAYERLETEAAERSRAEAALREARMELARASRIASAAELTASIAHEVNQPLSAVMAESEAALNWLGRNPPQLEEAQASIAAAIEAGERAVAVLDHIRSLIARGQSEARPIDVNDLVRDVMLLTGTDLARREVSYDCYYATDLPTILGDRIQLQQLVINLINNAVEAMDGVPAGDRLLSIRTSRSAPDRVRIAVEDNGQGFPHPDLGRLFQPFYSTKEHGMGMGLSLCRTIVEAHGGTIRAVPRTGGGARFEVDLPASGGGA